MIFFLSGDLIWKHFVFLFFFALEHYKGFHQQEEYYRGRIAIGFNNMYVMRLPLFVPRADFVLGHDMKNKSFFILVRDKNR